MRNSDEQLRGDGTWHNSHIIEDMSGLPVRVNVCRADTTESVYVKYRRTDGKPLRLNDDNNSGCVTVRFSTHDCNGVKFGLYVKGDEVKGNRNEVLYRLGFIDMHIEYVYASFAPTSFCKKSKIKYLPVAPITLAELEQLPEGTDISHMNGMYLSDTVNTIIAGDVIGRHVVGKKVIFDSEIKI